MTINNNIKSKIEELFSFYKKLEKNKKGAKTLTPLFKESSFNYLIIIPNKNKAKDYYPLFDTYLKKNDYKWFSDFFALLLMESLNKRIQTLTSKRIITLNEWAKKNSKNVNSYLNKAKRQTIPAFRKWDKWMISEEFEG